MPQTPGVPDHAAPAPPWAATVRKWLVGSAALAGDVVAAGVLHGQALVYVTAVLGVAASFGIYKLPNENTSRSAQ